MTRIFLSSGEPSGDAYAAALIESISTESGEARSGLVFEGLGGTLSRQAGLDVVVDTTTWGAISIVESAKVFPRAAWGFQVAKRRLAKGSPGLFIAIDFGFFNVRLVKFAKRRGWKTLYFIPPGSWRKGAAGDEVAAFSDEIVAPFPWTVEAYAKKQARAHFFGHPLKQLIANQVANATAKDPSEPDFLAVMPGSRTHELQILTPLVAKFLPPDLPATFILPSRVSLQGFQRWWSRLAPDRQNDRFTHGPASTVLMAAKAAVVKSGTGSLEAALCHCPQLVLYRVSSTMMAEARVLGFKRPEHVALPNIILGRRAIPELVQDEATPEECARVLEQIWNDEGARAAQIEVDVEVENALGGNEAITETAKLALSLISLA